MRLIVARFFLAATAALPFGCTAPEPAPPRRSEASRSPTAASQAASATAKVDDRPVIVALGNSLTAGYGLKESESYPSRLQKRLDESGYGYQVINAGVSGDTSAQGLNRLQMVLDYRPAVVIVELGPNDGLRGMPIESTRATLDEIIRRCQEAGAKVLLAGMTLPPNYTAAYIRSFEGMYKELAKKHQASLIPFFLEGVAAHPELNIEDGIHPNPAGAEIVAANILKALVPMIKK